MSNFNPPTIINIKKSLQMIVEAIKMSEEGDPS